MAAKRPAGGWTPRERSALSPRWRSRSQDASSKSRVLPLLVSRLGPDHHQKTASSPPDIGHTDESRHSTLSPGGTVPRSRPATPCVAAGGATPMSPGHGNGSLHPGHCNGRCRPRRNRGMGTPGPPFIAVPGAGSRDHLTPLPPHRLPGWEAAQVDHARPGTRRGAGTAPPVFASGPSAPSRSPPSRSWPGCGRRPRGGLLPSSRDRADWSRPRPREPARSRHGPAMSPPAVAASFPETPRAGRSSGHPSWPTAFRGRR